MFLRRHVRKKDGKEHTYWTIAENRRVRGGKVVQRHVLYLGEINSSQREAWRDSIGVFEEGRARPRANMSCSPAPSGVLENQKALGAPAHRFPSASE